MRSALYYPHTEVQSKGLLKTALLLWDRIRVIVPWEGYQPQGVDDEYRAAFELIGDPHFPSAEARKRTHDIVEEFVSRPSLPSAFSFASLTSPREIYELYPQKLLPETWQLLRDAKLTWEDLDALEIPAEPEVQRHLAR